MPRLDPAPETDRDLALGWSARLSLTARILVVNIIALAIAQRWLAQHGQRLVLPPAGGGTVGFPSPRRPFRRPRPQTACSGIRRRHLQMNHCRYFGKQSWCQKSHDWQMMLLDLGCLVRWQ